jgi:hypothetical protein
MQHLARSPRHLPRGPLRPPAIPQERVRQALGTGPGTRGGTDERRKAGVELFEVEPAVAGLLRQPGRGADDGLGLAAGRWEGVGGSGDGEEQGVAERGVRTLGG